MEVRSELKKEALSRVGSKEISEKEAEGLYVLMHPIRQKIVRLLEQSVEPLYIEEIAKRLGDDRRKVSFHLATLAEHGFVEGEYRIITPPTQNPGRGRGAKFYRLTLKGKKMEPALMRLSHELAQ